MCLVVCCLLCYWNRYFILVVLETRTAQEQRVLTTFWLGRTCEDVLTWKAPYSLICMIGRLTATERLIRHWNWRFSLHEYGFAIFTAHEVTDSPHSISSGWPTCT